MAEFSVAERLGFKAGPREAEQQADGYLFRAEQELQQAERAKPWSPEASKYITRAQGDLQRAGNLYEPIEGFSNVGPNLERLYSDRAKLTSIQARNERASSSRKSYRKARTWR